MGDAQQFAPARESPDPSDAIARPGRKQRIGGVEGHGNGFVVPRRDRGGAGEFDAGCGLFVRVEISDRLFVDDVDQLSGAVVAGYGVTFISRSGVEAELAAGTLAAARVKGLEPAREISLVRPSGRSPTRAAEAFVAFARAKLAA